MHHEQRTFKRYDASLPVSTKDGGEEFFLTTANVSRSGAFIYTDRPKPLGFLVRLQFELPDQSVVAVMAKVARSIPPEERDTCGMGVAFFCLDKDHKERWDHFIYQVSNQAGLRSTDAGLHTSEPGSSYDATDSPRDARPNSQNPREQRHHERHVTSFLVRLKDRERLHQFLSRDISAGGMFLQTPLLKHVGEEVELIIVHPETEDEFRLGGTVTRIVKGSLRERGMGIAFHQLNDKTLEALREFILTGINFLDAYQDVEDDEELLFSPAQWKHAL